MFTKSGLTVLSAPSVHSPLGCYFRVLPISCYFMLVVLQQSLWKIRQIERSNWMLWWNNKTWPKGIHVGCITAIPLIIENIITMMRLFESYAFSHLLYVGCITAIPLTTFLFVVLLVVYLLFSVFSWKIQVNTEIKMYI